MSKFNLFIALNSSIIHRIFHCRIIIPHIIQIKFRKMSTIARENDPSLKRGQGLLTILENNPTRLKRIKFLGKLFETNGFELRIAGGAVRDILRGTEPQDIDFATTARPEQSLEILKKHEDIFRIIVTASGQKHGTVAAKFKEAEIDFKRIKLDNSPTKQDKNEDKEVTAGKPTNKPQYDSESPYEITTLRCDRSTDGRHAEVEFINDWRVDAERRDLTINAMFLTLDEGKLIDYFDGESDLKSGVVRFVGDAELRIKEDYLRILRFFRFWSRYGRPNQPDPETTTTLQRNFVGLEKISGERIWQEIKKTMSHLPCLEVVQLMLKMKLFNHIGLIDGNLKDYDEYVKNVLDELRLVQTNVTNYSEKRLDGGSNNPSDKRIKELLPAILFASTVQTYDMCMNAYKRMKFSNSERDSILYIIENRTKTITIQALKYQLAMAHAPERPQTLTRMRALLIYKGRFDLIYDLESWQVPNFPLTGHTVSQEVKRHKLPGDKIKIILESIKDHWTASDYSLTKEELEQTMHKKLDELKKTLDGSK